MKMEKKKPLSTKAIYVWRGLCLPTIDFIQTNEQTRQFCEIIDKQFLFQQPWFYC